MTDSERYDDMRDKIIELQNIVNHLQAENERLEIECEKQYEIAQATIRAEIADGGTSCHWCEDTIRAEAYKECIEKVKDMIDDWDYNLSLFPDIYKAMNDLDNLLKEFERKENITYDD